MNDTAHVASAVCPVVGKQLRLQRSGRELLHIPHIAFGTQASRAACTMIVGPNGAGKSLLVRVLCHLQQPDSGLVHWAGSAPDGAHRHRVGLMLQKPVLLKRRALSNLTFALRLAGHDRKQSIEAGEAALSHAGLEHIAYVQAHRLSGGEQQRLALARALLLKPEILFLDEATANVDPASTQVIEEQLLVAISQGLTVVMVSHDPGQVKRLGEHIVLMHKGQVLEDARAHDFFEQSRNVMTKRWIAGELLV